MPSENEVNYMTEERTEAEGAPSTVEDDVVTPWTVSSSSETGVDYDKLISKN